MRTRNHEIKVRLNDEELADLNAKVAKTRYGRENYIRAVLAGYEIMEAPDVETQELLKQICRIGNNMNHLLFLAQCQNFIDRPELRKATEAIWECRKAILKAYATPSVRKKLWGKEETD